MVSPPNKLGETKVIFARTIQNDNISGNTGNGRLFRLEELMIIRRLEMRPRCCIDAGSFNCGAGKDAITDYYPAQGHDIKLPCRKVLYVYL